MRLRLKLVMAGLAVLCTLFSPSGRLYAANHREAPITALDHKVDITDWYAFVSPENPSKAVMILNVDPFLEPGNGPICFPFDPGILYEMKVDNNHDGKDDVIFQFRFKTEQRLPGVFTVYVGGLAGIPPITALDGPGSDGLGQRQSYTVTMVTKNGTTDLGSGQTWYAVPTNVGTRTMMNYNGLRALGTYTLAQGVRVFAGTEGAGDRAQRDGAAARQGDHRFVYASAGGTIGAVPISEAGGGGRGWFASLPG